MIRKLLTSSLLGLLVATGAQAGGLIPGSDTFVRNGDTAASHAVADGTYRANGPAVLETQSYGYALKDGQDGASESLDEAQAQDALPTRRPFSDAPMVRKRVLVPASDGF